VHDAAARWREHGATLGVEHAGAQAQQLTRLGEHGVAYVKLDARHLHGAATDAAVSRASCRERIDRPLIKYDDPGVPLVDVSGSITVEPSASRSVSEACSAVAITAPSATLSPIASGRPSTTAGPDRATTSAGAGLVRNQEVGMRISEPTGIRRGLAMPLRCCSCGQRAGSISRRADIPISVSWGRAR